MKFQFKIKILAFFLALIPLCSCSTSDKNTVVVDFEHAQVGQPGGQKGLEYSLQPCSKFALDVRNFDFKKSLYPDVQPNAIQVIIANDRQYSANWDSSGLTRFSQATLTPINDSQPFEGLKAGDTVILAIGQQRLDELKGEIILKALWVGMIKVN